MLLVSLCSRYRASFCPTALKPTDARISTTARPDKKHHILLTYPRVDNLLCRLDSLTTRIC